MEKGNGEGGRRESFTQKIRGTWRERQADRPRERRTAAPRGETLRDIETEMRNMEVPAEETQRHELWVNVSAETSLVTPVKVPSASGAEGQV